MKRCPKCSRTYDDSTLNFCLADGTPLIEFASEPTVVIPRNTGKKKGKLLMWLAISVAVIGIGVIGLAAIVLYQFSGKDDTAAGSSPNTSERRSTSNNSKPKPSPSATVNPVNETNSAADNEPDLEENVDSSLDEPTPIGWDTTASGFKGEPGKTYTFLCPGNGTAFNGVFGSDVYTDFSSICNAAVHMGTITLEKGGIVTIEYRPGRQIYGSTERNGIKTHTTGEAKRSFVIKTERSAPTS
jgi:hypothetical protein